jgi:hypothetical protein
MNPEYLGLCFAPLSGHVNVWVNVEPSGELSAVYVGESSFLVLSFGPLTKTECELQYPSLWTVVEQKFRAEVELDNGL